MYKFLIITLLISNWSKAFSQIEHNYCPIAFTDTIPVDLQKIMKARLEKDKSQIQATTLDKKKAKYKCEMYDELTKDLIKEFNHDYFLIDTLFTPYLQSVADKIYAANPQLNKETRIYGYRSNIPNACSYGEGTIAFNLGLLSRLENESQLAYILCHELAHYHMKHTDQEINKIADLNYDKDLEKEIQKIKNSEYNKYSKLKSLMEGVNFNVKKHSRVKESEADSMGLVYLKNTNYNPRVAMRCMEILDACDSPLYTDNLDLKKYFNFPDYVFKDSWIEYDTLNIVYGKEDYSDTDTLSTHPDCKKRYMALKKQLDGMKLSNAIPAEQPRYNQIRQLSEFESIASLYHFNNDGEALFETLILLEKYPDNAYLHAMVGKCFYYIHQHQVNKTFGLAVDFPDNRFPENYNRFLNFIHQLRLIEIVKISSEYLKAKQAKYGEDEEFLYAMILNSKISPLFNKESLTAQYKKLYPKGKYLKFL